MRIYLRRGTSAQWAATNPVLGSGEPGVDTTTGDYKIGDGVTAWTTLPYRYVALNVANAFQKTSKTGFVGIEADGDASVTSFIGQANATNGQMRFRLSRATPDPNGATDFLINAYTYGMGIEYPGLVEFWANGVSVHNNNRGTAQNKGGQLWIDDESDAGGIWLTAWDTHGPLQATPYSTITSQKFDLTTHGPIKFQVRASTDTFDFQRGANGAEVTKVSIDGSGNTMVGGVLNVGGLSAAPTIVGNANLGGSPPAPTIAGTAARGVISIGTGTAPAAGVCVTITLPAGYSGTPVAVVSPSNFATTSRVPFATGLSATSFELGFGTTPSASQPAGTYKIAYMVMG